MKNVLILGSGRSGKSTLSRKIKNRIPEYDLIHIDSIRNAILCNLDHEIADYFMDYDKNEFFQKSLLEFLDAQTSQGLNMYGTILEGAQIMPAVLSTYKNLDNTIVAFLGHGNLEENDFFNLVRSHDVETDWTFNKTDEELRESIKWFHERNRFIMKECEKYGFKYFDTHENRDKSLDEVSDFICMQLNS